MRPPRRAGRRPALAPLALAAIAAAAAVTVFHGGSAPPPGYSPASTWRGLVGETHPRVSFGRLRIVVLRTPSVAERLARVGYATGRQEREWTAQARSAQQQVLVRLATHGLAVRPRYSFARVLDGFSAELDPRAEALLEQDADVAGIYPVRAAFPAALSTAAPGGAAPQPSAPLPGDDGTGIEIALLDTGVDRGQPYLHGHVERGYDVAGGGGGGGGAGAAARPDPRDPARVERHGTELAGLLVGAGGPEGIHGAAPGATVLPVRVAGWQRTADGSDAVYARSDQLIAGLERAVDPNGDGDAHDAVRVALVGVTEPYAAFADSPEAQAVDGAFALDTLVVVPAGNGGAAGPAFGSLDGPGGAAGALTVGALDPRPETGSVELAVWHGLETGFDARLPLLGAVAPSRPLDLAVGRPRGSGDRVQDWFDPHGLALAAGKAALVQAGSDPVAAAAAASEAGAAAVLLYGGNLPAGSLGLSSDVTVPAVELPPAAARLILRDLRSPGGAGVALGRARAEPNPLGGRIASFSSRGLAFSGALKPDAVAPGVGQATSDPGAAADGEPAFTTVNGTSAAAAAVAGDAAVLAEARPGLGAAELRSLLVGTASPDGAPPAAGGAGAVDVGAAAAAELTASLPSLELSGAGWRELTLRDVSSRRLVVVPGGSAALALRPRRLELAPGKAAALRVRAHATPGSAGVLELHVAGGEPLAVPWTAAPRRPPGTLIPRAALEPSRFAASDTTPAVLTVWAGRVATRGGVQIEPVAELDVLLYSAAGAFEGVLARERDLLPGSYSFAVDGRSPSGSRLRPGRYELRLVARPTDGGAPSRLVLRFSIESTGDGRAGAA